MKKPAVMVLGGRGFLGSAVVDELQRRHIDVLIGTRAKHRKLQPSERRICFQDATQQEWNRVVEGCDAVVNAVGILRQRWRESYEQVHHTAIEKLAKACAKNKTKLIHVSALGIYHPVSSRFLTSKRHGEQALMRSKADWYLMRPSLIEGERAWGAQWFRKIAQWPIHCTPANARGRVAPIQVAVLAQKIADLVLLDGSKRIHEVGGDQRFTYPEYLRHLAARPPWFHLKVPALLVRAAAHLFDLLHITPLSFGHYELMQFDNLPDCNAARSCSRVRPQMSKLHHYKQD